MEAKEATRLRANKVPRSQGVIVPEKELSISSKSYPVSSQTTINYKKKALINQARPDKMA
jgi:hypothetical protein